MLVNDFLERFSEVWDPAEVDAVVSTHLHTDHVGRNTRLVDGAWVPTFPNARYHFVREEFEFWQDAEGLCLRPYQQATLPLVEVRQNRPELR